MVMVMSKLTLKQCIICKTVLDKTPQELIPLPCSYTELSLNLVVLGSTKQNVVLIWPQGAQSMCHTRGRCSAFGPVIASLSLFPTPVGLCRPVFHWYVNSFHDLCVCGPQIDTAVESREMAKSVV